MITLPVKRVILDKNFVQGENRDGTRLRLLAECGATFVLTDTLIYEFCTDEKTAQWPATQRKLFKISDKIEVWHHVSDLLQMEIAGQKPIESPVDQEATERVREWFRGGETYVPPNLAELAQAAYRQREVESVGALIADSVDFCEKHPELAARVQDGKANAKALLGDLMGRHEFIAQRVKRDHGNPDDAELYIRGAQQGLGPEWFAYQHVRSMLALQCLYMARYGLKNPSSPDFVNSKLDSDYIALLHYADVLATNDARGLADICSWMHGRSKIILSTTSLDNAKPKDEDIEVAAHRRWEREGRTHGHDRDDWFWARAELIWRDANLV